MNLDNLEIIEPELLFKFKIQAASFIDICDDDSVYGFICQSNNSKFIAFKYQEVLYIIENQIKTILRFQSKISNCSFSEDSKYSAIFLHDCKYKLLILFDLKQEKIVFTKKIHFLCRLPVEQKLNFYQNSIIMTSSLAIESFSLQGEQKFQLQVDRNYSNIHIKLNEKFLIISHFSQNHQINEIGQLIILSTQSFKNLKRFTFCEYLELPFSFSQNLLFYMPLVSQTLLILREITTHKIIRKYEHSSNLNDVLFIQEINNKQIIGYDINSYFKFDISKGTIQNYSKSFPMIPRLIKIPASKGLLLFIEEQIEKTVWKKNHFKKFVQLKFYKMKI